MLRPMQKWLLENLYKNVTLKIEIIHVKMNFFTSSLINTADFIHYAYEF